jgi:deoxyribodipyrimidine photolyase-related protein
LITTKPYVSGAAYLGRMGDYCESCSFDPKKNCPLTNLYWAFLARHQQALKKNPRLAMPLRSLQKRAQSQRRHDQTVFEAVSKKLSAGKVLRPENIPTLEA